MLDLILILLEKINNNAYVVVGLIVMIIAYRIYSNNRADYLFRNAYVKKEVYNTFKAQTRGMIFMYAPVTLFTHLIYLYSAYLHKDIEFYPELYVLCYMPLLGLIVIQRIKRVTRKIHVSWMKGSIFLIPGTLFHILYLISVLYKKKNTWILVLIMLGSLILPAIAEFVLMYIISDKDKKMVVLKMKNGKTYHHRYEDVIDDGKGDFVSVRVRKKNGNVGKVIKIRREDIEYQEIYLKKEASMH